MKRVMKFVLGIGVMVSVILMSSITVQAELVTQGAYTYEVDEQTKEASLMGTFFESEVVDFIVPKEIVENNETYTVTKIGDDETIVVSSITFQSFQLPDSIKEITAESFYSVRFPETINLPAQLEAIGQRAFYQIKGLKQLSFPASLKSIGESAFAYGELERLTFTHGLTEISDYAFSNNHLLGEVVLPDSLIAVGNNVFVSNSQLTSIVFPISFSEVPFGVLLDCGVTSLDFLEAQPNIKTIGVNSFANNRFQGLPTTLKIPDNIEIIKDSAFYGLPFPGDRNTAVIEQVLLSGNIKEVGEKVFFNQPLKFINVPKNQADKYKTILSGSMEGVTEPTIICDGSANYSAATLSNYQVDEGATVTLQAFAANKYQLKPDTGVWEIYQPSVQWFKDGQLLTENTGTLTISDLKSENTGTYYATVEGERLADIQVGLKKAQGQVVVQYVDSSGKQLKDAKILTGAIGTEYDASTKEFLMELTGYKLDEKQWPTNTKGVFSDKTQTVQYVYLKDEAGKTDNSGNSGISNIKNKENQTKDLSQEADTKPKLPEAGENAGISYILLIVGVMLVTVIFFGILYRNKKGRK
jgi:hypothetical protein